VFWGSIRAVPLANRAAIRSHNRHSVNQERLNPSYRLGSTGRRRTWGNVQGYNVFRVTGASITQSSVVVRLGAALPTTSATSFDDLDVKNNVTYTHFVVAQLTNGRLTGPSNFATIKR
jgi:hypothetical protein